MAVAVRPPGILFVNTLAFFVLFNYHDCTATFPAPAAATAPAHVTASAGRCFAATIA